MYSPQTFKMEDAVEIKDDLDDVDTSMQPVEDDDAYEDTGELELPKQLPGAWLARVPKTLYDCWASQDDDEPVQIGVLRQYENNGKYRLLLDANADRHKKVPKQYNLSMSGNRAQNTFIFTEKDLPGYKLKGRGGSRPAHNADRRDFLSSTNRPGVDKPRRYQSYRRAIPKQTALAASITNEGTCTAVENEEYNKLMKERLRSEQTSKKSLTLLEGDVRQYSQMVLGGPATRTLNEGGFDTFVRTGIPATKTRRAEQKTARMPANELLDRLFDCFKQYKYWSMTSIKQNIPQPEAYLREKLGMIGDLVKSGQFIGTYQLKPEAEMSNFDLSIRKAIKEEQAPENAKETSGSDDQGDEDDEIPMEDVL